MQARGAGQMSDAFVSQSKRDQLKRRMTKLGIHEKDLIEKFILGSGKGGQKVNKTSSCVYLRHTPTKIEIKCQRERSRSLNRHFARRELCDRIEERILGEKSARRQKQEKIRRQKRRRSRRQKEKLLADKHKQSDKKKLRQKVAPED
jgi:protein subunit release factor B